MTRRTIEDAVRDTVEQYLRDLRGTDPHAMHDMVMRAAERPLLEAVLRHAQGNQRKAAEWLGINRNTLHRKLVDHQLLD